MKISNKVFGWIINGLLLFCLAGAWLGDNYPKYTWPILTVEVILCVGCAIVLIRREARDRKEPTNED